MSEDSLVKAFSKELEKIKPDYEEDKRGLNKVKEKLARKAIEDSKNLAFLPSKRTRRLVQRVLSRVNANPQGLERYKSKIENKQIIALGLVWERMLKIALEGKDTDAIAAAKVLAIRFDPDFNRDPEAAKGRRYIDDLLQMLRGQGDKSALTRIKATERTRSIEVQGSSQPEIVAPAPNGEAGHSTQDVVTLPDLPPLNPLPIVDAAQSRRSESDKLAADHAAEIVSRAIHRPPPPGGAPRPTRGEAQIHSNIHTPDTPLREKFPGKNSGSNSAEAIFGKEGEVDE